MVLQPVKKAYRTIYLVNTTRCLVDVEAINQTDAKNLARLKIISKHGSMGKYYSILECYQLSAKA